jgi:hypothetical protein
MNALLEMARGRYFTWLFDDDLYEPGFLQTGHDMLAATCFPPAVFSSFKVLWESQPFKPTTVVPRGSRMLSGREFLSDYFGGRLKLVSTAGLFDTARLRETVGGVEELCPSAIGLYGEFLFLIRCGLFDRVCYMDAPFIIMRSHTGSWSEANMELEKYLAAGQELVRRSAAVMHHPSLVDDLRQDLLGICRLHLYTFAYKSARLEITGGGYGLAAAYRAVVRLVDEHAKIRRTFVEETVTSRFDAYVMLLPALARHILLVLVTLAVHRVRRFFPGFLKRSHSEIGV